MGVGSITLLTIGGMPLSADKHVQTSILMPEILRSCFYFPDSHSLYSSLISKDVDLFRRFGPKCSGCGLGISPQDLVRKARDKVFHLKCFTCFVCHKQLVTGEELYVVGDTKFVCKEDYSHRDLNGRVVHRKCSYYDTDHQLDSFYDDEEELEEENGMDGEENFLAPKMGEANNNSLLGLSPGMSPGSALDKTPPMADSSTERDLMNDSEGNFNLLLTLSASLECDSKSSPVRLA